MLLIYCIGWLKPVVGDETMAMCIVCKTTMKAHLSSIVGHSIGKKHCELLKTMVPTASITELLQPRRPDPQHLMELKLAVYVTGNVLLTVNSVGWGPQHLDFCSSNCICN